MTIWSKQDNEQSASVRLLQNDARIRGIYNERTYRVERLLGEGANGRVYLVSAGRKRLAALKLGYDAASLQSEINLLSALNRKDKPYLLDADDAELGGLRYPFYVMPYIEGVRVTAFIAKRGRDWTYILLRQLLARLDELHRQGWAFGDVKPENILVSESGRATLVDYGGVSRFGDSVRQFTELYDRGYWNAGSRTAEASYDIFAVAALGLRLLAGYERFDARANRIPQNRCAEDLVTLARQTPACKPIAPFLEKAIQGRYDSADAALQEYRQLLLKWGGLKALEPLHLPWLTAAFISSFVAFVSVLWLVLN
ncbi:serine/threonine protein kinase [Xylanibacillus composti]|uniref:Protein kinase domain-containing protein n=1 Tax=Xylanibacillus composti TaxID=1572762 RepID=A0A8J4H0F8_9BACL|nr:serine/threonine protein kinase [Xylanibacillus composti]GIQ67306.1 hypothetical protein XYCOK13_01300 [Xylanibacillus composti]